MKATPILFAACLLASFSGADAEAAQRCKSGEGNLCFSISGTQMQRINSSPAMQRALKAVASKLSQHQVIIYQGYRTAADQAAVVRRLCGPGRSSCPGAASPRSSKHVVSTAADPMIRGNVIKPLCHAENQARVEHLGPRSAAAVYGYGNSYTWGHIDDATGSNYTPRNCARNEGLNGTVAQGTPVRDQAAARPAAVAQPQRRPAAEPVSGAPVSPRVQAYKDRRVVAQADKKIIYCNRLGCGTDFWFKPGVWGDN